MPKLNRNEMIEKMRLLPQRVEAAVAGLNDEQLDTPYGEGKWTVRQVVHHLADAHCNGFARVKWVLTEDKPFLKAFEPDGWAELNDTSELPLQSSLMILQGVRDRMDALLTGLPEESWQRKGVHPSDGEITLDDWLVRYSGHGERHLKQITDLRAQKNW